MKRMLSVLFVMVLFPMNSVWRSRVVFAQTETPTPTTEPAGTPTPTTNQKQQDLENTQKKVEELQNKLKEVQGQKESLNTTLQYINTKISLSQAEINKSQSELNTLETDLNDLSTRIDGLDQSLDMLSQILVDRVNQSYKQKQTNPLHLLILSNGIADFVTRYRYIQIAQDHTREIMQLAEQQKANFDLQKAEKEKKQIEVEKKREQLNSQKTQLANEKAGQQRLLDQTNNDEKKYQQLLAEAEAELQSLSNFSASRGGGVVAAQNSPDGWYFSQRDERWAYVCIGDSCGTRNEENILSVGCLISSTAMIKKKYGENVTPVTIAKNPAYFFSTTAYMLQPWPAPAGMHYQRIYGYNPATIDAELNQGKPVIVHIRIGTRDGHFLVLKSGSQGNYIMHDPIEGYDKPFSSFYKTSQIDQMNVLRN